ncbi:MAG: cation:proton antiporter [Chloroflexi bacterium]|nr:cation:proton antiporter [Chloroflexota bacterium]
MESSLLALLGVVGVAASVVGLIARRLRVPQVLLYLLLGALAGPSLLNIVNPDDLGEFFIVTLEVLVALIVFEGAFSIDARGLRRTGLVVRNLLTVGMAVTFLLATLLAGALGVVPWGTAFVFGALVTVTGPTVIGPLVRRLRLNDRVKSVLLAEGVLIDPLGAILAVVVLEVVLSGLQADPFLWAPSRLGGGALIGLGGGAAVWNVMRIHREPDENDVLLLVLGMAAATFAVAERLLDGSGLTAMAVMGVSLGALPIPHREAVTDTHDTLTRIMVAAVFVLATAAVDLSLLADLWPRGFIVVGALMVFVRPAAVWLSARNTDLTRRERLYVGLVGPRGVVAAALAAFAGEELGATEGGPELTALVFLTILLTIAIQSSYAGPLARALKVEAMRAMVAGGGTVGRRVATQLVASGYSVLVVDTDPDAVARAQAEGLEAQVADCTDSETLRRLGAGDVELAIGVTGSDQANLLFSQFIRSHGVEAEAHAVVHQPGSAEAFRAAGVHALRRDEAVAGAMLEMMGNPAIFDALTHGEQRLTLEVPVGASLNGRQVMDLGLPDGVLVVLVERGSDEIVPRGTTPLERGDRLLLFGRADAVRAARDALIALT